jgi:transposase-like protein
MNNTRRRFSAEDKAKVVRRHLADKVPVSDLADEFDLQPSLIHLWVRQLLEQAERAFERAGRGRPTNHETAKDKKIEALEAKLSQRNEVISELMMEHVQLKKALGEL